MNTVVILIQISYCFRYNILITHIMSFTVLSAVLTYVRLDELGKTITDSSIAHNIILYYIKLYSHKMLSCYN